MSKQINQPKENIVRAYIQYLTACSEWTNTERMSIEEARIRCANMDPRQEAFIRICN